MMIAMREIKAAQVNQERVSASRASRCSHYGAIIWLCARTRVRWLPWAFDLPLTHLFRDSLFPRNLPQIEKSGFCPATGKPGANFQLNTFSPRLKRNSLVMANGLLPLKVEIWFVDNVSSFRLRRLEMLNFVVSSTTVCYIFSLWLWINKQIEYQFYTTFYCYYCSFGE